MLVQTFKREWLFSKSGPSGNAVVAMGHEIENFDFCVWSWPKDLPRGGSKHTSRTISTKKSFFSCGRPGPDHPPKASPCKLFPLLEKSSSGVPEKRRIYWEGMGWTRKKEKGCAKKRWAQHLVLKVASGNPCFVHRISANSDCDGHPAMRD